VSVTDRQTDKHNCYSSIALCFRESIRSLDKNRDVLNSSFIQRAAALAFHVVPAAGRRSEYLDS